MTPQTPTINREREFYDALKQGDFKGKGWSLLLLYSWGVLESGYFQNELAQKAYNPFSVKAFKSWTGKRYLMERSPEWDEKAKNVVYIPVEYRAFNNFTEAITDLTENVIHKYYPWAWEKRADAHSFFPALVERVFPKYCPGPDYAKNLIRVYDNLKRQNNGEFYQSLMG